MPNFRNYILTVVILLFCYPAVVQAGVVPSNDDCGDAAVIGDGCTAFDITGATTDGPAHLDGPPTGCNQSSDPYVNADIWYIYTATCTGNLTVSTCGQANYDTKLAVYSGTSCMESDLLADILACNDDFCDLKSQVTVPVVFGEMYQIRVGKFDDSSDGMGSLCITCEGSGPGTEACGEAQDACLDAIAPDNFKNKGQEVSACAQAANPFLYDGLISEECHSCIVSAVASKKKEDTECGPECDVCELGVCSGQTLCGDPGPGQVCSNVCPVEGGSCFCHNVTSCDDVIDCTTDAECPEGWRCASSCCFTDKCLPPCGTVVDTLTPLLQGGAGMSGPAN